MGANGAALTNLAAGVSHEDAAELAALADDAGAEPILRA
jgi:hypothetical protein